MVTNLKFCKFDDTTWGFRLTGGCDFDKPLTVIKVIENSLAEQAGMRLDDVIVRINDTSTVNMTHLEAHALLKQSGNNFMLGIMRQEEMKDELSLPSTPTPIMSPADFVLSEKSFESSPKPTENELYEISQFVDSNNEYEIKTFEEIHNNEIIDHNDHIEDAMIAEIISGEAEVLKDHNVLGVNFQKIIPQSGVFKNSQVFKQLNDEAIKTKVEMDKEQKKWSTFLQKPNRPIPQKKTYFDEITLNGGYKVQIVKQKKPRVAPDRTPTPPPVQEVIPEPELSNIEPEVEQTFDSLIEKVIGRTENNNDDVELVDDDLPNLHKIDGVENDNNDAEENIENDDVDNNMENEDNLNLAEEEQFEDTPIEKTKEELFLEEQLANVQTQLLALSNLPFTIQATLDAVTAKLSELVPAIQTQYRQRRENEQKSVIVDQHEQEEIENVSESVDEPNNNNNNDDDDDDENTGNSNEPIDDENVEKQDEENKQKETNEINNEVNMKKIDIPVQLSDNDWEYKKHQEEIEWEHQQRLIRERITPKPPNRAFGPLTPQERPIHLPGGRKWRNAKDAYNDEFIAEVLTSQAEIIMGQTLGVNFLKYQKPEKKVNIENSEVYRMIHHMEPTPKHGIEVRSEKVAAAQDIRVV